MKYSEAQRRRFEVDVKQRHEAFFLDARLNSDPGSLLRK